VINLEKKGYSSPGDGEIPAPPGARAMAPAIACFCGIASAFRSFHLPGECNDQNTIALTTNAEE
jgi:hypothetical protein